MSLETFAYGFHDLQTVTVARLPPYPASAPLHHTNTEDERNGFWVILIHGGAWRDPTQTSTSYLTPALSILSSTQAQSQTPTQEPPRKPSAHISGLASISYRLSAHPSHPQDPATLPSHLRTAKHPDHLADIQTALSFLQEKYKFGGRYVLVGHSCGATLAFECVMSSLNPQVERQSQYERPLAILGMAGIYDLRGLRDKNKDISAYQEFIAGAFGNDEGVWDAVSPGVVKTDEGVQGWKEGRVVVLAHSKSDELCNIEQSENMQGFLEERGEVEGREVRFLPIEGKHDEAWEKGTELARGILWTLERLQASGV
ncbi:Alpha/Beta hydrolase protein [Aspergillus oleicola]